jgi:hypothetical protein
MTKKRRATAKRQRSSVNSGLCRDDSCGPVWTNPSTAPDGGVRKETNTAKMSIKRSYGGENATENSRQQSQLAVRNSHEPVTIR